MPKSISKRTIFQDWRAAVLLWPLFAWAMSFGILPQVAGQEMSDEGQQRKAAHDYLFQDFVQERDATYRETGQGQGLKELTVREGSQVIHNGDELLLPPGAEKVAVFFRHLAFRGSSLDQIEKIFVLPFSPDKEPPRSQQVQDFYRVQMPSVPLSKNPFDRMKVQFFLKDPTTSCTVDTVIFIAQSPIAETFDSIPYCDLGSEFPRERVSIIVETDHELLIDGTSKLDRSRWFRMHETPGSVHQSFESWAADRNFFPGRGMLKFQPGLTTAWGKWEPLRERPDTPGAADLSFFETYDAGTRARNTIPQFKHIPYASCFNDWPDFMSVPLIGRGTPKVENFHNATELAAAYVHDQIKDGGSSATWWEVKNESTFQSEWAYHWREKEGIDGWGLLSDFHNQVADAVHEVSPSTRVGGPAAAYMQLHQKDFALFRDHARFIRETRGKLDFFSYHFYENAGTLGAHARRDKGYTNYLLGRYEATLDMLRAEMHNVDNVLPILITECGSLQNGRQASENWLRILAWNAFLTKTMQRPDQIDLFVPFVFLHMPWNPASGDAAFTPKVERQQHVTVDDFNATPVANFFELWRNFDGHRLPVTYTKDWLDVVAVHKNNEIFVAVTNMGGRQLLLDLSSSHRQYPDMSARQTRLNYQKGKLTFDSNKPVEINAVPVDVNETTVIRLIPKKKIQPTQGAHQNRHYARETAIKSTGEPIPFMITTTQDTHAAEAQLVIGVHRRDGITTPLKATINQSTVRMDAGDADEFTDFFAPLTAKVPVSALQTTNTITVTAQPGTTITSVQLITTSVPAALSTIKGQHQSL
ncbi:MAG: beta-agarase [Pirellulales bacterium]